MYLLDTHVFIWALTNEKKLSTVVFEVLKDNSNKVYISVATLWEIVIKSQKGNLQLNLTIENLVKDCQDNNLSIIDISPDVLTQYETLPLMHFDPFDRLLIAQAKHLKYTLITKDSMIKRYDVKTIW